MTPIFMIKRIDGKTDNIYEADFVDGKFTGGAKTYSYDEIETFIGVPSGIMAAMCSPKMEVPSYNKDSGKTKEKNTI